MKLLAILACLGGSGVAHAEGSPAEAAVRAVIGVRHTYLGSDDDGTKQLRAIRILGPDGSQITSFDGSLLAFPDAHLGEPGPHDIRSIVSIDWKLGSLTIVTDDPRGVAWFQAPVTLAIEVPYSGMQCCQTTTTTLRASGIVVRDAKDKSWHVATLALSRQLADAALFRGATEELPSGAPTVDENALAKAAATWFPETGDTLLGKSAGATPVASGTSTSEYATGPAVGKLVAAWDKLGMRARTIETTTYGKDNAIGLVVATVALPYKKKAAPMTLYAIATRDPKGTWRWVSLQWTTALAKPPNAAPEDFQSTNDPNQKR